MINDTRWNLVLNRQYDASFFYSVATTGVYCRPSCAARTPKRENVEFFETAAAAERAGFRACKRCKPTEARNARIAELCRFIESAEEPPSLHTLAEHAGMSTFHLHRVFKAETGLTPRAYAAAHRRERVRGTLKTSASVTDAIFDAGFAASSRFYEDARRSLGMTPTAFRKGGQGTDIRFAVGECTLGAVLVAMSAVGVCALALGDDPDALVRDLQDRFPSAELVGDDIAFSRFVAHVVGLIDTPHASMQLPLDVRGTAFQRRVWQALTKIPAGRTLSYTELAKRIGSPSSVRAVASACAANTLAIAIPCHRIVRTDGSLSGYRWGVERKRALLERERSA